MAGSVIVSEDDVTGVVANGKRRAHGLRGDVCQRDGGGSSVGTVEWHDVITGIGWCRGDLRLWLVFPIA